MSYLTSFYIIFSMSIVTANSIFCSAYCQPNQCSGIAKTQCTACDSPFLLSGSNCIIDSTSGYTLYFQSNNMTATPVGSATCSSYSITGTLNSGQTFTLTTASAIIISHIKVRLIMWVILYDNWNTTTDYLQAKLNTSGETQKIYVGSRQTSEQVCGTASF